MKVKALFIPALLLAFSFSAYSQVSRNISLPVRASAKLVALGKDPVHITLAWPQFNDSIRVQIHRKDPESLSWGAVYASLDSGQNTFTDTNAIRNKRYDYRVTRFSNPTAIGYIHSGYVSQFSTSSGSMALIIDETYRDSLKAEIDRLFLDLLGDGWKVYRRYVKRTDTVPDVKKIIVDLQKADNKLSTVFLLGQVPVPYSGNIAPDGHPDHQGAWPADGFYGDLDGDWTDNQIQNTAASRNENKNLVGDGKYDQSLFPSPIELNVGRVSTVRLPAFTIGEIGTLRRYLNKNHAWRSGLVEVPHRALIDDNFGSFEIASSAWRGFYPLVDTGNIVSNPDYDFRTDLNKEAYLFAAGAGAGGYNSAAGVITSGQFAADSIKAVFISLAGSYFGDWDASGNLLRAAIASSPYALASFWGGIPNWVLYPMGMNETIGHCTRLTMNNAGTYAGNFNLSQGMVHIGLMGDPTLTAYPEKMVKNFKIDSTGRGEIRLRWDTVPGAVYAVFRSNNLENGFQFIGYASGSHIDKIPNGKFYYMVRALTERITPSGRYTGISKGAIDSVMVVGVNVKKVDSRININLWPNPAHNELNLYCEQPLNSANWSIFDLNGKLLKYGDFASNEALISIAELSHGLYLIKVQSEAGIWDSKFLRL